MKYFIRKIHVVLTFLLMTSVGYAYGEEIDSSACEENCCPCQPESCVNGFVSAEVLYWRASERGLDTCFPRDATDTITTDGKVTSIFHGRSREPDFDWNPGFRVGVGVTEIADGNFDIAAFWTHYHSRNHGSAHHGNKIRWNLNFDVIDVVAAYESDLGSCFVVRPFAGLRAARIDQKVRLEQFPSSSCSSCYSDNTNGSYSESYSGSYSGSFANLISDKTHNKEKFCGIGPLIGVEGDYSIGCGFSVYAYGSVSWLYGHYRVKMTDSSNTSDTTDFYEVRKHLEDTLAAADVGLGVRWQTCFCNDMQFTVQLGLEHHTYFDYNRIGDCCGDLNFDGLNFGVGLEF